MAKISKEDLARYREEAAEELGPEGIARAEEWRAAEPLVSSSPVAFARFRMERVLHLRKLLMTLRFWSGFRGEHMPDDFLARSGEIAYLQVAYGLAEGRAKAWGRYLMMSTSVISDDRSKEGKELMMDLALRKEVIELFGEQSIDDVLRAEAEACEFYEAALRYLVAGNESPQDWTAWKPIRNRVKSERESTWMYAIEKGKVAEARERTKQEHRRIDAKVEKAKREGWGESEDDLMWDGVDPLGSAKDT